ncbi:MAG: hypothetical protein HYV07_23350 [Deltaproteobacteria bacterium]|nr:hypothetical protein [Deltaproteobacteria bacterium]
MRDARSDVARKRLLVLGHDAARWVGVFAEAGGVEVVSEGAVADVIVLEASAAHEIAATLGSHPADRTLVVAPRRLSDPELRAFTATGVHRVIHGASSVLDLAIALSDLLFSSSLEQRSYGRRTGGLPVRVVAADGTFARGRLVAITRAGGVVLTPKRLPEGSAVRLELELGNERPALMGRVAYVSEDRLGVEFALEQSEVAPAMADLRFMSRPKLPTTA